MSSSTCPVCRAEAALWPSASTVLPMIARTSRAALAVRSESRRISAATTAKPRPAAPACAASMLALIERMLVWKATESITSMTSPARAERCSTSAIAAASACAASAPRRASSSARPAAARTPSSSPRTPCRSCSRRRVAACTDSGAPGSARDWLASSSFSSTTLGTSAASCTDSATAWRSASARLPNPAVRRRPAAVSTCCAGTSSARSQAASASLARASNSRSPAASVRRRASGHSSGCAGWARSPPARCATSRSHVAVSACGRDSSQPSPASSRW